MFIESECFIDKLRKHCEISAYTQCMVWFLEMGMSCDSGNHHIKTSGSGSSLLLHIKYIHVLLVELS